MASSRSGYGDVLLQEYIPGGADAMKTLMVLYSRDSELLAYFMTRKVHIWPMERGVSALNESIHEPELLEMMRPFFTEERRTQERTQTTTTLTVNTSISIRLTKAVSQTKNIEKTKVKEPRQNDDGPLPL